MAHGRVTTRPDASQLVHLHTDTGTSARHNASLGRVTMSHRGSEKRETVQEANSKLVMRLSESGSLITQLGIMVGTHDAQKRFRKTELESG